MNQGKMLILLIIIFFQCVILHAQVSDTVLINGKYNVNKEYYKIKIYSNLSKDNKLGEVLYYRGMPISDTVYTIYDDFLCDKPCIKFSDISKNYFYDVQSKKVVLDFYFDSNEYSTNLYSETQQILNNGKKKYFVSICDSLIVEIEDIYDVQGVHKLSVFVNSKNGTTLYNFKSKQQTFYPNGEYYSDLSCFCFQDSACYRYDVNNLICLSRLDFTNVISNVYSRYWVVKRGDKFGLIDHFPNSFNTAVFEKFNGGFPAPKYKVVIDYAFDTLYRFSYPALISKKENKFGLIYLDEEILKPIYDSIYVQGSFYIYTKKIDGINKYGLVYNRTVLTEPIFSDVINTYGHNYLVQNISKDSSYVYTFDAISRSNSKTIIEQIIGIDNGEFSKGHFFYCYKMKHYINSFEEEFYMLNGDPVNNNKVFFINSIDKVYYLIYNSKVIHSFNKKRGDVLMSVKHVYDSNGNRVIRKNDSQYVATQFSFEFKHKKKIYKAYYWYSTESGFEK